MPVYLCKNCHCCVKRLVRMILCSLLGGNSKSFRFSTLSINYKYPPYVSNLRIQFKYPPYVSTLKSPLYISALSIHIKFHLKFPYYVSALSIHLKYPHLSIHHKLFYLFHNVQVRLLPSPINMTFLIPNGEFKVTDAGWEDKPLRYEFSSGTFQNVYFYVRISRYPLYRTMRWGLTNHYILDVQN